MLIIRVELHEEYCRQTSGYPCPLLFHFLELSISFCKYFKDETGVKQKTLYHDDHTLKVVRCPQCIESEKLEKISARFKDREIPLDSPDSDLMPVCREAMQ